MNILLVEICVLITTNNDLEDNEDYERKKQIILVNKFLYCNMQTLSRFMDVKCAAGEDPGGNKKHYIRN